MIVKTVEGSLQRFAYLEADSAKRTLQCMWPCLPPDVVLVGT